VDLIRRGSWQGTEIQIVKRVIVHAGAGFEVEYTIENTGANGR